jgi:hypothetical protein
MRREASLRGPEAKTVCVMEWLPNTHSPPSWQAAATGCSRDGGGRERFGMGRGKGGGRIGAWGVPPGGWARVGGGGDRR